MPTTLPTTATCYQCDHFSACKAEYGTRRNDDPCDEYANYVDAIDLAMHALDRAQRFGMEYTPETPDTPDTPEQEDAQ